MVEFLKTCVICLTTMGVLLPLGFLVAISLPHNSELRQMALRVCYWGVVLIAFGLVAMPLDLIPDVLFPVGFADDAMYLAIGCLSARKALKPAQFHPSHN